VSDEQLWPDDDYVWEIRECLNMSQPYPLSEDAPEGYRLHSWCLNGTATMIVCWERVPLSWHS
jgi:hypothetical protein